MYPPELVAPIKEDLVGAGFKELNSAVDVDTELAKKGTLLLVVNSVCGCAAGCARPGVKASVDGSKKPDHLATVFAGVDREATDRARQHLLPYPPSSPCIALFKDGKLVHFLERHHIESGSADLISENLKAAFAEFC